MNESNKYKLKRHGMPLTETDLDPEMVRVLAELGVTTVPGFYGLLYGSHKVVSEHLGLQAPELMLIYLYERLTQEEKDSFAKIQTMNVEYHFGAMDTNENK